METIIDYSDIVYDFIWTHLIETDELPMSKEIAKSLEWAHKEVMSCIAWLRIQGRIEQTTLKLTAYDEWGRENARQQQTWTPPRSLRITQAGRLVKRDK